MAERFRAIGENLSGAAAILLTLLFSPLIRSWYAGWGASDAERKASLPGDRIVPTPRLVSTRAVNIGAPAWAVWPWIAQMGQGRGGWVNTLLWRVMTDPLSFVMERKMLLGIKERAEASA
jgi:hypothetical protein